MEEEPGGGEGGRVGRGGRILIFMYLRSFLIVFCFSSKTFSWPSSKLRVWEE